MERCTSRAQPRETESSSWRTAPGARGDVEIETLERAKNAEVDSYTLVDLNEHASAHSGRDKLERLFQGGTQRRRARTRGENYSYVPQEGLELPPGAS
jgi:hypothetical protein